MQRVLALPTCTGTNSITMPALDCPAVDTHTVLRPLLAFIVHIYIQLSVPFSTSYHYHRFPSGGRHCNLINPIKIS